MSSGYDHGAASEVSATDLATFDGEFEGAPVEDSEFEPLPDGKYQVSVERVELLRSKAGNPMLKWTLRVLGPQCQGRLLWRNNVIATAENLKWLKTDLHTCGLTLGKLSELPSRLPELLDLHLEVTKKTRGENESVFLNKRLDAAATPGTPAGPAGSALPPF
ncbi:MAG: DUF669 domain-containing protein [Armatimonadota bacterium]